MLHNNADVRRGSYFELGLPVIQSTSLCLACDWEKCHFNLVITLNLNAYLFIIFFSFKREITKHLKVTS